MDLNLLKTFRKVADCGSLTKAAKLLNQPKSKVSRDLVKLEDELEQTLLNRSTRGVTLTERGFSLLQSTRDQLEKLESSLQKIKSSPNQIKGSIKLTAPEDLSRFILTRLICDFMTIYPEVSVGLFSASEFLDFQKYDIDLALRIGKLEDSSLVQKKIAEVPVIFAASTLYLRKSGNIHTMGDLKAHNLGLIRDLHGTSLNKDFPADIRPKFTSNSMCSLKDFVKQDHGVATLPAFLCKEELASKEFSRILPHSNFLNRGLYLLSSPSAYVPSHIKIFKQFLFSNLVKEL